MAHSSTLRRLREEKTNYRKRKTMLMGKQDYITVRISNENAEIQIHKPEMAGDKIVASAHSRYLLSKGWKGSRKSIPAAYLTGYLAGKRAISKGSSSAIMYSGTRRYTQRMAAALKGVVDAGMQVPSDSETFPPEQRLLGEHLKVKNNVNELKSAIEADAA